MNLQELYIVCQLQQTSPLSCSGISLKILDSLHQEFTLIAYLKKYWQWMYNGYDFLL